MSVRVRTTIYLFAGAAFGLLLLWGMSGLPSFGHYRGPYGNILNAVAVPERHVTDVVAAVTFDYRGLDTIGEEFILFVSAGAVALLLRTERDEIDEEPPEAETVDRRADTSDALRTVGLALVAPVILLGLYIVSHGHLTPGGGFQGGIILASALVLVYLAGEYQTLQRLGPEERVERADALGAAGFVVIGVAGLVVGALYLQNLFPLGPVGMLYSAGMIPLINLSVGLEVMGAFLLIFLLFLRQTLQVRASTQASQQQRDGTEREGHEHEAKPENDDDGVGGSASTRRGEDQ